MHFSDTTVQKWVATKRLLRRLRHFTSTAVLICSVLRRLILFLDGFFRTLTVFFAYSFFYVTFLPDSVSSPLALRPKRSVLSYSRKRRSECISFHRQKLFFVLRMVQNNMKPIRTIFILAWRWFILQRRVLVVIVDECHLVLNSLSFIFLSRDLLRRRKQVPGSWPIFPHPIQQVSRFGVLGHLFSPCSGFLQNKQLFVNTPNSSSFFSSRPNAWLVLPFFKIRVRFESFSANASNFTSIFFDVGVEPNEQSHFFVLDRFFFSVFFIMSYRYLERFYFSGKIFTAWISCSKLFASQCNVRVVTRKCFITVGFNDPNLA